MPPPAHQEHEFTTEFRQFLIQYNKDQDRIRRLLERIERELFGDEDTGEPGMKSELKLATDFRISVETGYTWIRRIGYGLVVLSGAIAAWWGVLHKKP